MDTKKLRTSANIEDRRGETYNSPEKQMLIIGEINKLPDKPIDTNPNGWESVNKDYSDDDGYLKGKR